MYRGCTCSGLLEPTSSIDSTDRNLIAKGIFNELHAYIDMDASKLFQFTYVKNLNDKDFALAAFLYLCMYFYYDYIVTEFIQLSLILILCILFSA